MRDRYGRHLFGQSCLMARRLVEAGVRFVTVHYDACDGYGWDSHVHSDDVRSHLLPTFDQGLAALLTDLDERGLLDETLVVAMGEMGRTPQPTPKWGRGHWSTLFPALLAGAGIRGGSTYGSSDKDGAHPVDRPVSPESLAATLYQALGIDPSLRLKDAEGREVSLVDGDDRSPTSLAELRPVASRRRSDLDVKPWLGYPFHGNAPELPSRSAESDDPRRRGRPPAVRGTGHFRPGQVWRATGVGPLPQGGGAATVAGDPDLE